MEKSSTELEQIFSDLENKWMNAWKNKDEKQAREIMADDFTLTSGFLKGKSMSKEEWLSLGMKLNGYDCHSFGFTNFIIRVYGNTALVESLYQQQATLNGEDRSGKFVITDLWVKQMNGQWQVVSRHSSLLP